MDEHEKKFINESRLKTFDLEHRKKMNFSLRQAGYAFQSGKKQFSDLGAARRKAKNIKWEAVEHLDKYLQEFEAKFTENGGHVIWAENSQQALDEILKICNIARARTIVKSKSIVTEEIHLNQFLSINHIDVIETDLGEYIQQLDNEAPYHIVAPAIHKSKQDIARLFHEKLGTAIDLNTEELTLVARRTLRGKYKAADIGITGANFILADIGGVAVTENEGNAWLSSSCPRIHIVITGIEKILPSVDDLGLFWPLLATHGSGQHMTVYNSIFTGSRQPGEMDGPEQMYVILLDNARTDLLSEAAVRESLYCIRCGACLNVCPVYKNIGGHTYETTYSGPIGAVIAPYMSGWQKYKHLSYASSLCGACTEICPVGINLHELLLDNRRKAVTGGNTSSSEKWGWLAWRMVNMSRFRMNMTDGGFKNLLIRKLFKKAWGTLRALPVFSPKSFNQLRKDRKNERRIENSSV